MRIDISERRVSVHQCDSIVRSLSEAITNSLNFKSEDSYNIEIHLDICKSGEDETGEEDAAPNDVEIRLSDLEKRLHELAVQSLNDKMKKIMEDPSRYLFTSNNIAPPTYSNSITCTEPYRSRPL